MMNDNISKKLNILLMIIILFFVNYLCKSKDSLIYANANLNKGIYEIKNPLTSNKVFIDETGKILLKSQPNVKISFIKDIFTGDIKLLEKTYGMTYENFEYVSDGEDDEYKEYVGKDDKSKEYYDLDGNKLNFDKEVIGAVEDNIFFKDGSSINILFNTKFRLENIDENATYWMRPFNDYITLSGVKVDKNYNISKKLYVYDKKLKFVRSFDGITTRQILDRGEEKLTEVLLISTNKFYGFNALDGEFNMIFDGDPISGGVIDYTNKKYLKAVYYNDDCEEDHSEYYDLQNKKIVDNIDDKKKVKFKNEKLISTIYDDKEEIKIYDIQIEDIEVFNLEGNKYYFVKTNDKKSYLYDSGGNRRIILESEIYNVNERVIYSDDKYIVIRDNYSLMKIYDKNLSLVRSVDISENASFNCFFDRYYIVYIGDKRNKSYIFDKNLKFFKQNKKGNIKFLEDKYMYDSYNLYDENFNVVKKFDLEVNFIDPVKRSDDKKVYRVYGKNYNEYIFDSEFDKEIKIESDESDDLKIDDNYILIKGKSDRVKVYDLNLNKLDEFSIDFNKQLEYKYITVKNDIVVVKETYDGFYGDDNVLALYMNDKPHIKFSMYKIGKGPLLKDYYYIGDLKDDFFTFVNGFYFGIMDYDGNIIYNYSIFDFLI